MPVLPPLPPVLENPFANAPTGHVYVLTGEKRSMFGVHVSKVPSGDESQSRVFAFRNFDDAACFRSRLVTFHERWGYWPPTVLQRPNELRMLDAIPQAATCFIQRRRAALTVQRWWLREYYTPGRPLWRRRMNRQFRCLPQLA